MNDYQKMASVLAYLMQTPQIQPSLAELSQMARLSPGHFQRKFASWVGVSPKAFLQCLTLENARAILKSGSSIQQAALDSGLSGPARLHDLCIKLEAATPGEIKSGGNGMKITYGFGLTPFGHCLLAESARGICYLAFIDADEGEQALNELKSLWPEAKLLADRNRINKLIEMIFDPTTGKEKLNLRAYVKGSRFQLQVWRALVEIPEGRFISYSTLARKLGKPGAARAVGNAVACNQLAYLIPCHRVIRESSLIGNYRWGTQRKKRLLAYESSRAQGLTIRAAG